MSNQVTMTQCQFNQCDKKPLPGSTKCAFHRKRSQCTQPGCLNQSVLNNVCARHGGKRVCQNEGCNALTRGRKVCPLHGGAVPKRFCTETGCKKQAHANHRCVAHGGGRYCSMPGCRHHIRTRGLCRIHAKGNCEMPPDSLHTNTLLQKEIQYESDSSELEDLSGLLDHFFQFGMYMPSTNLEDPNSSTLMDLDSTTLLDFIEL